jgi:catechol 2,3-dioxygenase
MTGLADYTIRFNDAALLAAAIRKLDALEIPVKAQDGVYRLTDPWGIGLSLAV